MCQFVVHSLIGLKSQFYPSNIITQTKRRKNNVYFLTLLTTDALKSKNEQANRDNNIDDYYNANEDNQYNENRGSKLQPRTIKRFNTRYNNLQEVSDADTIAKALSRQHGSRRSSFSSTVTQDYVIRDDRNRSRASTQEYTLNTPQYTPYMRPVSPQIPQRRSQNLGTQNMEVRGARIQSSRTQGSRVQNTRAQNRYVDAVDLEDSDGEELFEVARSGIPMITLNAGSKYLFLFPSS